MKLTEEIAQQLHRQATGGRYDWDGLGDGIKEGYRATASMLVENVPILKALCGRDVKEEWLITLLGLAFGQDYELHGEPTWEGV